MFLSPETLTALIGLGVEPEKLAHILHMIERDAESVKPRRSSGAERQARYEERKRQKASESVSEPSETSAASEVLPLSPSPRTPQPHTPTRRDISTPRAKAGPSNAEIARGFLAFWAAYPRRKAKDAAATAFTKAMQRIDDPDPLAVILAGIERALPGWDDPNFIPYPASWLNAGSWEDDAPTARTGSPRNERPDKLTAKHDNLERGFRAAERAADFVAANRTF